MILNIAWKKLTTTATKPSKPKCEDDAGFDLFSDVNVKIRPHQTVLIKTGYAVQMTPPKGWNAYANIEDASGNAWKLKLKSAAGIIDKQYTGDIGVIIRNNNWFKTIKIKRGSKIAQLVFHLIPETKEVEWIDKETERGTDGFGSTGTAEQ